MKKIKLLAVLMLCPIVLFGQLEVRPDGSTVANDGIFSTTRVNHTFSISPVSASVGLRGASWNWQNNTGVLNSPVVNIGVYGVGSGNPSNRNIGVLGHIPGSGSGQPQQNGIAIAGAVGNHIPMFFSRPYAGFFRGNVGVEGNVTAFNITNNSDYRYKENITSLNSRSRGRTPNNVLMLNPVSYNLIQRYHEFQDSTGATIREAIISEHSQLLDRHHYGLIAQEVQQLFPNLVFENGEGYLSINYIGLIPLLIATMQELRAEVDDLRRGNIAFGARAVSDTDDIFTEQIERSATLYQNTPNPFSQSTEIRFYLPTSVSNAILAIYDLNGRQIKQLRISERGEGSLVISGSQLAPGMYLYALIADGTKIDVKRMILTE